ncbi:MAG: helix-turn-helix domain-containing protein, partial [Anaerolineales bacterium]
MESSIGEKLKAARLARRLSLEQAAQQTRIRKRTLEAMENDDFAVIPSRVQLYGFVRIYAEFLGLDGEA